MKSCRVILLGLLCTCAQPAFAVPPWPAERKLLVERQEAGDRGRPVRTPADWARRREQILLGMQKVMGPLPAHWRKLPLDLKVLEEVRLPGVTRRKIAYRADPGDVVTAYLLIPDERAGRRAAVLCLHQTIKIGKDEPAGLGGSPDLHYALELAERGYVTLSPDYWMFGDYRERQYDPYEHGYVSGTMKGIWNHVRSLDVLQSLPDVDTARLGCIGHSLGGHNALWLAAFDPRVKAVVSSCGFSSFASYAASPYGGGDLRNYAQRCYMPRIAGIYGNDPKRMPFDWPEVLAALAPRPVFINAPRKDENFLLAGVKECLEAARPAYEMMGAKENLVAVHPDAGHSFPLEIREQAYAFLDRALRPAPSAARVNSTDSPRLDQGSRNTGREKGAPVDPPAGGLAGYRESEERARMHFPLFRLSRLSIFQPW